MTSPLRERVAFCLFLPLLILWTWKLLQPHPVPNEIVDWLADLKFAAAKTLHATMYAALTILAGYWLPKRPPVLALALALLMLHGVATEILQTMIPNRSGRAADVLIDWGGIAAGLAIRRSHWRFLWIKSGA